MRVIYANGCEELCYEARSFLDRLRGLIGRRKNYPPVYFAHCSSVHTFGMFSALDIAFLSERGQVLEVHSEVSPGRHLCCRRASWVLERFSKKETWLEVGDYISVQPCVMEGA